MNTRAGRLRRLQLQGYVPMAMRLMLWGLCFWFAVIIWNANGVTGRLAAELRQVRGLPQFAVGWEMGSLRPAGSKWSAARLLLAMEPGLPLDGIPAPQTPPPAAPEQPVDEEPEIPMPPVTEEPGLSGSEPADDLPAPDTPQPEVQENDQAPIEVTLKAGSGSNFLTAGEVVIRNETSINVNMEKVMSRKLAISLAKDKPQILIVHTHASEAYWGDDGMTVVDIGSRLAENLRTRGFNVIHDTTVYDRPDFNKAYSNALAGISAILKENPDIKIVLDIHRDAISSQDDQMRKPVTVVAGEKVAQMMFVVGTDNSGLPHDNWPQNLCLAVNLQKSLAEETPELMRPINLRRERFNQHATFGSLILEVGSYGNDSAEAVRAIDMFAEKSAPVLQSILKD